MDAGLLDAALDAKHDALRSEGLLEPFARDASFADVAGLRRLRDWIAKRKSALTPEGRRFGLEPPKWHSNHRRPRAAAKAWPRDP